MTDKKMLEITDKIELKSTDTKDKLSFATKYLVQINFTFDLTVESNDFKGTSHFCVRKDEIERLCDDLRKMLTSFTGTASLEDNDSDASIQFQINNIGQVFINGQVGGSHEGNFLKFKLSSDCIATDIFIKDLNNLLLYVDDVDYEEEYNRLYRQK
jgi:hypothetical protein